MTGQSIDLRSDTVTQPTLQMREAMYRAEVGDDGWGEDPTVNRLQELAAERLGKEDGLFVASGTMGNLVAALTHCGRGDEVILGDQSHTFYHEVGGLSALGSLHIRTIPNDSRGMLPPQLVEEAIRTPGLAFPRTGLICLENTHLRCGGTALTPEDTAAVAQIAHSHDVPLHLDGARMFNAAVALGVSPSSLAWGCNSVTFCLSKGLSAPVGSVLCGTKEFIAQARKYRRMVGGGMRQAGVIAAAGIVALETMVDRLAEDHENAQVLAQGLADQTGIALNPALVQTNIVIFRITTMPAPEFMARLEAQGVLTSSMGGDKVRMVTHFGIGRADVLTALEAVRRVITGS